MSRSLTAIDAELDQIAEAFDRLEEGGAEQDVLDAVLVYFGDLSTERDAKLDRYATFVAERSAKAKFQEEEAKRLASLAKANSSAAKRCKDYLQGLFEAKKWTKLDTLFHKFWIQNNGGKRPVEYCLEPDPERMPAKFLHVTYTYNDEAVREHLDKGLPLTFAKYGQVGTHLRIK